VSRRRRLRLRRLRRYLAVMWRLSSDHRFYVAVTHPYGVDPTPATYIGEVGGQLAVAIPSGAGHGSPGRHRLRPQGRGRGGLPERPERGWGR